MTIHSSSAYQRFPRARAWLPGAVRHLLPLMVALLVLVTLPGGMGVAPAWAISWPGRASGQAMPQAPSPSRLQEQPPPLAVQQLQAALEQREPRVTILAPADGSLIEAGDWELRLQVSDWPLVDAGPLGLGPHLLLMIDDQPPLAITATNLQLPALTPGSHRITVVAARPWGEAVKQPGALAQARVHRVAADPQGLPAPDAPQLLAVAPPPLASAQPILVDWLMPQAPLQHLRPDDTNWRLRLTLNGDSVLLDRHQPLWLSGWRPGRNAVVLELLNGRGEPLNPPYTSKVMEVQLDGTAPRPSWQQDSLDPHDLAQLLGEAPVPLPEPAPEELPAPAADTPLEDEPPPTASEDGDPAVLASPAADGPSEQGAE